MDSCQTLIDIYTLNNHIGWPLIVGEDNIEIDLRSPQALLLYYDRFTIFLRSRY
jgi:hypothetical protein